MKPALHWSRIKPKIYFTATADPDMVTLHTEGYYDHSVDGTNSKWVNSTSETVPTELFKLFGKKVIGWKKARWIDKRLKKRRCALIELEIAPNTQRIQPRNHKCRAKSAKVLRIFECEPGIGKRYNWWKLTGKQLRMARSAHDDTFVYRVGARVKPVPHWAYQYHSGGKTTKVRVKGTDKFVRDHRECSPGIHFFLDQKTAQRYSL